MKAKTLSILTAILAIVAVLGAMDLSGFLSLFPGDSASTATAISGGLATLGTIIRAIGDWMDDGQVNGSFGKIKCHPVALICAATLAVLGMSSCADMRRVNLSLSTPWGDVGSKDGSTTVTLRPIIIPEK